MGKHKDTDTVLQNRELKKENLRLQKKIAKLEVKVISSNNRVAELEKIKTPKPFGMSEAELQRLISVFAAQGRKQLEDEKSGA
jgi:predicted nucleotidyltransferase